MATSCDDTILFFKEVLSTVTEGPELAKILSNLLRCLLDVTEKSSVIETEDDEINEFMDVTLDAIKNFSLRLEGKPTEVEYHPAIMKM